MRIESGGGREGGREKAREKDPCGRERGERGHRRHSCVCGACVRALVRMRV